MQLHHVLSALILLCCLLRDIQSSSGHYHHDHDHDHDHDDVHDRDYKHHEYEPYGFLHELKEFWKHWIYDKKTETAKVVGTIARDVSKAIVHHYAEDFSHHDHPVPHDFVGKFMGGVKKVFKPKHKGHDSEKHHYHHYHHEEPHAKEHGNFDSYGRDAVRQIGGLASRTEKRIEKLVASTGLDVKNGSAFGGAVEKFKDHVRAIYPGTLWCGDGTKAKEYNELGHFNDTDACCREHDECPDYIAADSHKYGLKNTGLFTRSHCDCDRKFYHCLKKAESLVAKKIGITYFTVLGPQCFKEEHIVETCGKTEHGKCVEYVFEDSDEKKYQWFDTPHF